MNGMAAQIHSIPELIEEVVEPYQAAVRSILERPACLAVERIYLTGCGDSHHASLGAELAFEHFAGLPTEALTALQFARYASPFLSKPASGANWVIGTSVSGEVSRTIEALVCGRQGGATALALTAAPGSRVARAADYVIDTTQPPFQNPAGSEVPGVRSYVANQVALLLVAIHLGEQRGRLSAEEAAGLRSEITALSEAARWTIANTAEKAAQLAREWLDGREFVFVGGGPNFASAFFSAAKVLEASGDPALGQDTEEWAHLQYFSKEADTPTFLISAGDRDLSRMAEVAAAAAALGRRVAAVVPTSAAAAASPAQYHLPLAEGVREMFSPLISAIPCSLFAAYRAEVLGEPYFRNFGGGRNPEGGGGISRIRTSETSCPDLS